VDIDRAALHDVEAFRPRAFVEEVVTFRELLRDHDFRDRFQLLARQPAEELAAARGVRQDGAAEVLDRKRHAPL